jgi:hypothetical protein
MRVMQRTVIQEEEGGGYPGDVGDTTHYYKINLELSPTGDAGALSCSTALSNAVSLSVDHQTYTAPGVFSSSITPIAATDGVIIAGVIASNHNTPQDSNVTGASPYTTVYSHDTLGDAPALGAMYRTVVGASGSYLINGTYTPGFAPSSASRWALAAAALRTSATSPVQSANSSFNAGVSVTLGATPTVGNMLIMVLGVRLEPESDPMNTDAHLTGNGNWTTVAKGIRDFGINNDVVYILAKCVETGDPTGPWGITGTSTGCVVSLQEWAIT